MLCCTKKTTEKKVRKRKERIPAVVRKIVWTTYVGDNAHGKCFCCTNFTITFNDFECGHVVSEKNGGAVTVQNLRPICSSCNKSVGARNMDEFMIRYGIKMHPHWNGLPSTSVMPMDVD